MMKPISRRGILGLAALAPLGLLTRNVEGQLQQIYLIPFSRGGGSSENGMRGVSMLPYTGGWASTSFLIPERSVVQGVLWSKEESVSLLSLKAHVGHPGKVDFGVGKTWEMVKGGPGYFLTSELEVNVDSWAIATVELVREPSNGNKNMATAVGMLLTVTNGTPLPPVEGRQTYEIFVPGVRK